LEITILGIGHNTPLVIEICESCGFSIAGLWHYNSDLNGRIEHGYCVLGSYDDLFSSSIDGKYFALSHGKNDLRTKYYNQIKIKGGIIPALIHPTANISRFSNIEEGCIVGIHSIVNSYSNISENTFIGDGVIIEHDVNVGSNSFIAFGAKIGAYTKIGENVFIGAGAITISGKVASIGSNSIIGAGSVVTRSTNIGDVVCGNPAKLISLNHEVI